jgi:hypothetical protein
MTFEAVDFYLEDTTSFMNPIVGATVKVFSLDGTIDYGQVTTDSSGHAGFMLDSALGPYQVRCFKFGVSFSNPLQFTVLVPPFPTGESNTFDVSGVITVPPEPTDSRLCTAFGFFRGPDGSPAKRTEIQFITKFDPLWVDGSGVLKERVIVHTDETGYVQVNLFRNGQYDCTIAGEEEINRHIDVPDLPNCNIVDLIFPVALSVVYSPIAPYTIHVGETVALTSDVTASDGEDLGIASGDVKYTSDNTAILAVTPTPTGITIQGIAPGTANILCTRLDLSIVRIPDNGLTGSPQLVTVIP